ncbi:MAG: hypothetical protein ACREM1_25670, partial [Longimicrobiales bacterium]
DGPHSLMSRIGHGKGDTPPYAASPAAVSTGPGTVLEGLSIGPARPDDTRRTSTTHWRQIGDTWRIVRLMVVHAG